ncbi:MAG: hypothetical protein IAE86_01265 [Burkholderiaceae bacterium]|nr:hypothetical protein [Burkholderiaceae bacterium]
MATTALPTDLDAAVSALESDLGAGSALAQALPVPDIIFGGTMLVLVIMFHAFWIRGVTGSFLRRSQALRGNVKLWRADWLFALTVIALLTLHLAEIVMWSAAFVFGGIIDDWAKATWFAANCYTALGQPLPVARAWRLVPSMIAASGIFTFAWTASVLVNFVARYNELRAAIIERHAAKPPKRDEPR